MESGDTTLLADSPALVRDNVPPRYSLDGKIPDDTHFVGSIQSHNLIQTRLDEETTMHQIEQMKNSRDRGQKVMLGSFGTLWRPHIFELFANAARDFSELDMYITMRDLDHPINMPHNFNRLGYADLARLAPYADILASQGGTGTSYLYLASGDAPLLGITTNDEQIYNMNLIEHKGLGAGIFLDELDKKRLIITIQQLIEMSSNPRQSELTRQQISLNGASTAAKIIIKKFFE